MGLYYRVKCPECEYEFNAIYGISGSNNPDIEARKKLEQAEEKTELTEIYRIMDHPDVSVSSQPYYCYGCKILFNHSYITLRGKNGYYRESNGICPSCRRSVPISISMDQFNGKDNGYGECKYKCPKCMSRFEVIRAGIFD